MNLHAGKAYKINDGSSNVQTVLSVDTLGSTVVNSSLTSVGTLTTLTVDNVNINGTTMGHTSLTDALTFASSGSIVTVKDGAYDFDIASHDGTNGLKLGGTAMTATATELNVLDGVTAGSVTASKGLVVDANRDLATIGNLTSDGTVRGAALSADAVAIIDTARGSGETIETGTASTKILMSIPKATYRAAKIMYHIKKDSAVDTDAGEMLITYNGTNAFLTHYAEISTGSAVVGTWDATVDGNDIDVLFDPANDGAHTYSIVATQLIT